MDMRLINFFIGIGAGALRSVMGWAESKEPFDPRLFFQTLVRTALIGGGIAFGSAQHPIMVFLEVFFIDSTINKSYKIANNKDEK